ncbi:MAG TPA: hypothetical protein VFD30_11460 [Terriglobia bacterium]|jgi:hypothetical protein|nr:hypothetical protein [Terriglobia bacterium]
MLITLGSPVDHAYQAALFDLYEKFFTPDGFANPSLNSQERDLNTRKEVSDE